MAATGRVEVECQRQQSDEAEKVLVCVCLARRKFASCFSYWLIGNRHKYMFNTRMCVIWLVNLSIMSAVSELSLNISFRRTRVHAMSHGG